MGNIKHNDELLRVHDDGFDVVFNCDNTHQNGVSYHAEKNGKKTKIDPEYAMAALVKKVSGAEWPADLPVPSAGGYGYATEVANEVELTCERLEAEQCWIGALNVPDRLIVGENYEVTVNGVTGTYECFEYDGIPALGYPYEFESYELNKWVIYDSYDTNAFNIGMNLRPGETATIVILSIENILESSPYDEEVDVILSDEIEVPEVLIVGENYEVTVNGVTGTYECFEDGYNGIPTLGYPYEIMEQYEHGLWNIYSYNVDGINLINAAMNLRLGETATFVIKLVGEVTHKIDEKYLPESGGMMVVKITYNEDDDTFSCNHTYDEIVEAFPNIIFVDDADLIGYACCLVNDEDEYFSASIFGTNMGADGDEEVIASIFRSEYNIKPDNIVEYKEYSMDLG